MNKEPDSIVDGNKVHLKTFYYEKLPLINKKIGNYIGSKVLINDSDSGHLIKVLKKKVSDQN